MRRMLVRLAVVLLLATAAQSPVAVGASTVPAGFADESVATVDDLPTALAWLPSGDLLVALKGGRLLRLPVGGGAPVDVLDLSRIVCTAGEQGMLGVTVDPEFGTNRYLYTYATVRKPGGKGCVNRVSRWVVSGNQSVDAASERRLIDNIPSPASNHKAGDLAFGDDGFLYVAVGDGGCDLRDRSRCQDANRNARRLDLLLGKMLRVDREGAAAPGNPFSGPGTAVCAATGRSKKGRTCREIFATGLRNPFRFAFDPDAAETRFFVNDVGGGAWEEIDRGEGGADYGWNVREGFCATGSTTDCGGSGGAFTDPVFAYGHQATGCESITGGAFVPAGGGWPAGLKGDYLYGDFVCGTIFRLTEDGPGYTSVVFASGAAGVVDLAFAPDGTSLYYTLANGQIRRIVPTT